MSKRITVVLISIIFGFTIMDSGYGKWQKELNIEGNIKVIPNPKVLEEMGTTLQDLKSAEELRLAEEQQLLAMEKMLEEQKKLDELLDQSTEKETMQQDESSIEDKHIVQPSEGSIEENSLEDGSAGETVTEELEEIEEIKEEITEEITDNDMPTSNTSIEELDNSADPDSDDSSK